jgi:AcrR family transcriptional regulator
MSQMGELRGYRDAAVGLVEITRACRGASPDVLSELGWAGFTVTEVASRSGVHESSIYRRWGTRERLAIEAMMLTGNQYLPIPDTGTLRGDLVAFALELVQYLTDPIGSATAHALTSPMDDPTIAESSARYFEARFQLASVIVSRAVLRGELPDSAISDGATAIELLVAPVHFRYLVSHQPITDELLHHLADLVIRALGGATRQRAES